MCFLPPVAPPRGIAFPSAAPVPPAGLPVRAH